MHNIIRMGMPTNFKFGTQMEYEDPYVRQAPWHPRSKVTWCVWQVLADKSRKKRLRNTKISRNVVYPTGNKARQFKGQMSRSPCWLMMRPEVHHIFQTERPTNLTLGKQVEYEYPYHRKAPWPPMSKVKVARSRSPSDSCASISRKGKVTETPKLVERLPNTTHNKAHQSQGQR